MPSAASTVWGGIDAGKTTHWDEVVDRVYATLLSRRVLADQTVVRQDVRGEAGPVELGRAT